MTQKQQPIVGGKNVIVINGNTISVDIKIPYNLSEAEVLDIVQLHSLGKKIRTEGLNREEGLQFDELRDRYAL